MHNFRKQCEILMTFGRRHIKGKTDKSVHVGQRSNCSQRSMVKCWKILNFINNFCLKCQISIKLGRDSQKEEIKEME